MIHKLASTAVAVTLGFAGGANYATKGDVQEQAKRIDALNQRATNLENLTESLGKVNGYNQRYMWCIAQYVNAMNGHPMPDDGSCASVDAPAPVN